MLYVDNQSFAGQYASFLKTTSEINIMYPITSTLIEQASLIMTRKPLSTSLDIHGFHPTSPWKLAEDHRNGVSFDELPVFIKVMEYACGLSDERLRKFLFVEETTTKSMDELAESLAGMRLVSPTFLYSMVLQPKQEILRELSHRTGIKRIFALGSLLQKEGSMFNRGMWMYWAYLTGDDDHWAGNFAVFDQSNPQHALPIMHLGYLPGENDSQEEMETSRVLCSSTPGRPTFGSGI